MVAWLGPAIGAIGSIAGGLLGSQGGGSSVPKWINRGARDLYNQSGQLQPQSYWPGADYVGMLPEEQAAFGALTGYGNRMFMGQGTPWGQTLGALGQGLSGGGTLGQMSSALSPYAMQQLQSGFGAQPGQFTPTFGTAGGLDARSALQGMMSGTPQWGQAQQVAQAGQGGMTGQADLTGANSLAQSANAGLGQFGQAGNLNATSAFQKMLTGTPDYSGLSASINAANAPILRQLNEEIIPGLNQRAQFLSNPTGGIKSLNRIMPEVADRMSENAAQLTEAERQRALGAQQWAAGTVGQAGLQQGAQASQNIFGAGQAALDRALQERQQLGAQGYGSALTAMQQAAQDRANAAGLVSQGGLSAAGLGLDAASQLRGDVLGLGQLAGNLGESTATNAARWGALFPSLAQTGRMPYEDAMGYAGFQRGLAEQGLAGQQARWNFQQQEPYNRLAFRSQILQGAPAQPQQQGSSALGALGGALAGGQLASSLYGAFNPAPLGLSPYQLQGAYQQINNLPAIQSLWGY